MGENLHEGAASPAAHEKGFTIIVNGRKKVVTKQVLSFAEILALAFEPVPSGSNWVFTVTYKGAEGPHRDGTLLDGQTVTIKNGTIFNVTATDKS